MWQGKPNIVAQWIPAFAGMTAGLAQKIPSPQIGTVRSDYVETLDEVEGGGNCSSTTILANLKTSRSS